jgi:hypothetical protein
VCAPLGWVMGTTAACGALVKLSSDAAVFSAIAREHE